MRLIAVSLVLLFGSQAAFACAMRPLQPSPNMASLMDEIDAAAPVVAEADPTPAPVAAARIEASPARVEPAASMIPEVTAPPAKIQAVPARPTPSKTRS